MPVSVTGPIVCMRTTDGTHATGLQDVLARAHDGTLVDLPGMRADQRAPVVTLLAVLSHLLRRYSSTPLVSVDDWRGGLDVQLGTATTLVGGPDDAPQFLQPVLVGLGPVQPFTITEADHLMPATRPALKTADEATLTLPMPTAEQFRYPRGSRQPLDVFGIAHELATTPVPRSGQTNLKRSSTTIVLSLNSKPLVSAMRSKYRV